MALVDRLKKKNAEARVAGKHPLVELGADLNVRTAYFQGLALVALVDDDKIDAEKRSYLQNLGTTLGMTAGDVASSIDEVTKLQGDDNQQEAFVTDVVSTVRDLKMRKLFLAEQTRLSTVRDYDWAKVKDLRSAFAGMMECDLHENGFDLYDEILLGTPKTADKVLSLESFFSRSMLDYLFPGHAEASRSCEVRSQMPEKPRNADENTGLLELEDWLVSLCKNTTTQQFDEKEIRKRFAVAGVKDRFAVAVIKMMLPHAWSVKKDYDKAIETMPEDSRRQSNSFIDLGKHDASRALQNYCSLFGEVSDHDWRYTAVLRAHNGEKNFRFDGDAITVDNGSATTREIKWSWHSKDGERNAKRASMLLFERILSEYEFRAKW